MCINLVAGGNSPAIIIICVNLFTKCVTRSNRIESRTTPSPCCNNTYDDKDTHLACSARPVNIRTNHIKINWPPINIDDYFHHFGCCLSFSARGWGSLRVWKSPRQWCSTSHTLWMDTLIRWQWLLWGKHVLKSGRNASSQLDSPPG